MNAPTPLRTIVVATDFSPNARVARAWAEELAAQHHATLVLVHAFRPVAPAAPEFVAWPQECYDEIRAGQRSELDRETDEARRSGVTVESELDIGSASEVVIAAAERHRADLIVSGTRGRTGWKRLALGSTAARLIRKARCPVLTVNPTDTGFPRPVRTILVPTDFSEDAALATETAIRLFAAPGADRRVILLHAYHVPIEATYLPGPVLMDAISAADARVQHAIGAVAERLRAPGIGVDVVTCEGDPPGKIVEQARCMSVDVIAMGTHGRSGLDRLFLGSTAERVVVSAGCPVLTVRRADGADSRAAHAG
jgi:nucleotide-binding universal stress UspA family protein